MKRFLLPLLFLAAISAYGCRAGYGCKGNGKNIGAERILSGDAKTAKEVKKAGKFKS